MVALAVLVGVGQLGLRAGILGTGSVNADVVADLEVGARWAKGEICQSLLNC